MKYCKQTETEWTRNALLGRCTSFFGFRFKRAYRENRTLRMVAAFGDPRKGHGFVQATFYTPVRVEAWPPQGDTALRYGQPWRHLATLYCTKSEINDRRLADWFCLWVIDRETTPLQDLQTYEFCGESFDKGVHVHPVNRVAWTEAAMEEHYVKMHTPTYTPWVRLSTPERILQICPDFDFVDFCRRTAPSNLKLLRHFFDEPEGDYFSLYGRLLCLRPRGWRPS